jgi:hypothetical protein
MRKGIKKGCRETALRILYLLITLTLNYSY